MKSIAQKVVIVLGIWTLIAIADGGMNYAYHVFVNERFSWSDALRIPLIEHWIWASFTPLVFWAARRWDLLGSMRWRAAGIHALVFLALSTLHCELAQWFEGSLQIPTGYAGSAFALRFVEEFYSDIWMYWPLVGIQALLDAQSRVRDRQLRAATLESQLAVSQLALLRAQIQPHFLFNTLNAVSALIRFDAIAAQNLLADLATLLRASFENPALQETSLERELDLVRCYLRIQQARFHDRLVVRYEIEPTVMQAATPTLVLQSLVENAVIHGVVPAARLGHIVVRARREIDRLVIDVADDGAGLTSSFKPGVGISNTHERLRRLYASNYAFSMDSAPDAGVRVSVSFPFKLITHSFYRDIPHEDSNAYRGRRAARAPQSRTAPAERV